MAHHKNNFWDIYINSYISDSSAVWAGANADTLLLNIPIHIITACNPLSEVRTDSENKQRNESLLEDLNQLNVDTLPVIGHSPNYDWQEESFAISGLTRIQACEIACKYDQRAIFELHEEELLVIEAISQKIKRRRSRNIQV